jgi:hypothetical protein
MSDKSSAYTNLMAGYVTAGNPADSEVFDRVTKAGDGKMPPGDRDPLTADQVDTLEQWIIEGALP